MANHKSAEKRARQNEKRRMRNKTVKTRVKHVTKLLRAAAEEKSKEEIGLEIKVLQPFEPAVLEPLIHHTVIIVGVRKTGHSHYLNGCHKDRDYD